MCEKKERVFSNNKKIEEKRSLDGIKKRNKKKTKILETYQ